MYEDDIEVKSTTSATGIKNEVETNQIRLFPNPVTEKLSVELQLTEQSEFELILLNNIGQTVRVYNYAKPRGTHQLNIDVNNLTAGLYFARIQYANRQAVNLKFVKK